MAVIAQTTTSGKSGAFSVTKTTLTSADTLVWNQGTNQLLVLNNTTGSTVNVTIDGNAGTTVNVPGYGGTLDISGGKIIAVPANSSVAVKLDTISFFLQGTVNVTGGTGVEATLYTY